MCYNPSLVHNKLLGAPASVKLIYCEWKFLVKWAPALLVVLSPFLDLPSTLGLLIACKPNSLIMHGLQILDLIILWLASLWSWLSWTPTPSLWWWALNHLTKDVCCCILMNDPLTSAPFAWSIPAFSIGTNQLNWISIYTTLYRLKIVWDFS